MACRSTSARRAIRSADSLSIHSSIHSSIPTSSLSALRIRSSSSSSSSSSSPATASSSRSILSSRSISSTPTSRLATPTSSEGSTESGSDSAPTPTPPKWTPNSLRVGLIARKRGMTSYFRSDTGAHVPATVLQVDSNQVSAHIGFDQDHEVDSKWSSPPREAQREQQQLGINQTEKYYALQVAATDSQKVTKQIKGHLRKAGIGATGKKVIREFRVTKDAKVPLGTKLSALHFVPGQSLDVRAITRGHGFQGVMKRHGFHGLRASHGVSISHRSHGSTGQHQDPGRVFPGKKMAGRMGGNRHSTVQNLRILRIDVRNDTILVLGNVPGPKGGVVTLSDSKRDLVGKAKNASIKGKLRNGETAKGNEENLHYLPEGVEDLPFPAGTKEMEKSWPQIVEAAPVQVKTDTK